MRILLLVIFLLKCYSELIGQEKSQDNLIVAFGDTVIVEKEILNQNSRTSSTGFSENPTSINGINLGSAEWVDYNSDGYLDIFINGFKIGTGDISHATLFQNQGDNSFSRVDITDFTRTIYGDQDWGDYNNDGHIDLILTGTTSGFNSENITEIHKNLGEDNFIKLSHSLPKISRSDVHWEDLDNDGDLDIFLMGLDSNLEFLARVYVNVGNDSFEKGPDILTGGSGRINFNENASIWADLDNDGDLDGVLGYSSQTGGYGVKLYENLGNLSFIEKSSSLPQLNYATLDVFDFNNDNLLDLVVSGNKVASTGSSTESAFLVIMKNDGDLSFSQFYNQTTGAYWGSIDCGDFNNDGYSDVLVNGYGNNRRSTHILVNSAGLNFEKQEFGLTNTHSGGALWGHVIPNSSLDIFIHGTTTGSSSDAISKLFENETNIENLPPSVPIGITYSFTESKLIVEWDASIDDHSGFTGISYNVRLGTNDNNFEIIQGLTTDSGSRKIMDIGNNGLINRFSFNNLDRGKYYFQVQAMDNAFNASAFSQTIEICNGIKIDLPDTVFKCPDEEYELSLPEYFTYVNWSTGETSNIISVVDHGLITVEATDSLGCISRDSIYVSDVAIPEVDLGVDIISCEPPTVTLDASFTNSEYLWQDGSTESYFNVTDFGVYWVEVKNSCGVYKDTIKFMFQEGSISFIPNVFTPNNDGKNDYFQINSEDSNLYLRVFNRSGKIVYESKNYQNDWDGNNLASGVYYYLARDQCGKSYKGYITILY